MTTLLEQAGRSFLRAFIASLVVLIPGILAAPSLSAAAAVAWGGSISAVIAGIRVFQLFVPQFSVGYLITKLVGSVNLKLEVFEDSFVRAFLGSFLTLLVGVLGAADLNTAKALAISALIAAGAAGIRAVEAILPLKMLETRLAGSAAKG